MHQAFQFECSEHLTVASVEKEIKAIFKDDWNNYM